MNTENKIHRLYWACPSGRRIPAGVAFYNEVNGDYRLKVDLFDDDKVVFLKAVSVTEDSIGFRIETLLKKKTGGSRRVEVGFGHANRKTGYPVFMSIGPYDRTLVLEDAA